VAGLRHAVIVSHAEKNVINEVLKGFRPGSVVFRRVVIVINRDGAGSSFSVGEKIIDGSGENWRAGQGKFQFEDCNSCFFCYNCFV